MHAIVSIKILLLICGNPSTFSFIKFLPDFDYNKETQLRALQLIDGWGENSCWWLDCHYFVVNIVSFLTHCIITMTFIQKGRRSFIRLISHNRKRVEATHKAKAASDIYENAFKYG